MCTIKHGVWAQKSLCAERDPARSTGHCKEPWSAARELASVPVLNLNFWQTVISGNHDTALILPRASPPPSLA